ncbi:Trimethylguanosine synthase [Termitomyces sp. J132]|nr:hypothetical protein C0989_008429 [Termitomyces sp. Mn162]KNZ74749.1 Trimethylguanosine synthase [Termitomyces sp. J132]
MGKRKTRGRLSGVSLVLNTMRRAENSTTPITDKEPTLALETATALDRSKRQKTETDGESEDTRKQSSQWVEKYDASGLVPHYTHASEVPEDLQKYFAQRERYFSRYYKHPGCLLDREGWYSVTPELVADQIAERCRCDTILDAFCGVGGNAIAFAKTCQRVIALDTSPIRLALARHNAQIYGVADRIEFILADYIAFAKAHTTLPHRRWKRQIDVIFLSPPWGGPSYLSGSTLDSTDALSPLLGNLDDDASAKDHPFYSLSSLQPINGSALFNLSRQITHNIAYYLPRNTCLEEVAHLLEVCPDNVTGNAEPDVLEYVEVEEEWMGSKLKALTCYFGGLVTDQEALF